ncbi:hypothetical protein [Lysobacter silvisoli]|uniref:Uncharacterized protein n=1 Tax=Lysobacter silvisoli TaxID=2293254 RepID=A0A371K5N3_9GAMM|nr:hypothetical protein [Lysobacter silvisoli]RDZ29261.1 hypothetical protein DX914_09290 [Lysobacter silvisoli]
MQLRIIVAALAVCGSLTGCDVSGTVGVTRQEVDGPTGHSETTTVTGSITFTRKGGASSNRFAAFSGSSGVDVSDIAIDITGQRTAVLDGFGTGTLLVKQGGSVIGSTPFQYAVADSMAVVADPATVNAWLANFPTADGYDVELPDIGTVDTEQGTASLTVETLYGTTVVSTGSTSWTSSAGSGCTPPGGNDGNPIPEQPIELPGEGGVCNP